MLTCMLNAAEGQVDIALGDDNDIICTQTWLTSVKGPIRGAEILTPALASIFSLCKLEVADVRRWACVYGPGSFTGIRLVLGTVAAIRRISQAQNASIDFMQALALDAIKNCQKNNCTIAPSIGVMTHARRQMVHYQVFNILDGLPVAVAPVELRMIEDVAMDLQNAAEQKILIGSGLLRNIESLNLVFNSNKHIVMNQQSPSIQALWQLAAQANYHGDDIEPLYIRPCDAVENLDSIAIKQGQDPRQAHARLNELLSTKLF